MLEARAIHTGRSPYNHLLAMAQTHGIGRECVEEVVDFDSGGMVIVGKAG